MADFNPAAAGGALVGGSLGRLFGGYKNPAEAANPYYNQMPGVIEKYLSPYVQAGNRALPGLEREYGSLLSDPGGVMNRIGGSYQQSPGFQFALQQAMQGAGHAAAAGGMAGSPQHEQQSMELATNLANKDYNTWITHALGLYGQGLGGEEHLYDVGARAGIGMGEDLASILAQRGRLAYEGQNAENQRREGLWGGLGAGAGTLAAFKYM